MVLWRRGRYSWPLWRRFYAAPAGAKAKIEAAPAPPQLPGQKVLDLLKFRPIAFADIEASLKKNAGKQEDDEELRMEFNGCSLLGTLSCDAGIVKEDMLVTSALKEKDDTRSFYLLVSNFAMSSSTTEEVRMWFPKGIKVMIKHPRAVYTPKGRVILEVHNPMYMDFVGIELPDGQTIEDVWNEANKALGQKDFIRTAHLYSKCIEKKGFSKLLQAYSNRCQAWLSAGYYEIALDDAKKALEINPFHFETLLRKGHVLYNLGNYRGALGHFQLSSLADESIKRKCAALIEQKDRGIYDLSSYFLNKASSDSIPELSDYIGPVKIAMATGEKGRGLFATEDMKAGRIILVWNAAVVALREDMAAKLMRLCLTSRKALWQLMGLVESKEVPDISIYRPGSVYPHDNKATVWFDVMPTIEKIGSLYAFQIDEKLGDQMALWTLPGLLNSSCVPNVSNHVVGKAVIVRASRDIRAGEELTLPYMNLKRPLDARRSRTMELWGFTCKCLRCKVEAKLQKQSPSFSSLGNSMDTAVQGLSDKTTASESLYELCRISCEVEKEISVLPSEVHKHWVRTSYHDAYSAYIINERLFRNSMTTPALHPGTMMEALHVTSPGYGVITDMLALARTIPSPDGEFHGRIKELILEECVSTFGQQSPEVTNSIIKLLLEGVDLQRNPQVVQL